MGDIHAYRHVSNLIHINYRLNKPLSLKMYIHHIDHTNKKIYYFRVSRKSDHYIGSTGHPADMGSSTMTSSMDMVRIAAVEFL